MTRTAVYARKGSNLDGSFQALTFDQKTLLTKDRDAFVQAGGATSSLVGLGGKIYSDILSFISTTSYSINPATPGMPIVIINQNVSPAVFEWIAGAKDVNAVAGFEATLIQDYTVDQYTYRYGADANTAAKVQNASNLIALNVADDILKYSNIPDITGIGALDAGAIAATVFKGDYAGWAGTLLFPYLGVNTLYEDWLLNSQPFSAIDATSQKISYKSTPGSYDLIAAIMAGYRASHDAGLTWSNFVPAASAYVFGPPGATADPTPLVAETNAWFAAYYAPPSANGALPPANGFTAAEFLPGPDLTFSKPLFFQNITYALGKLAADSNILLNPASGPGIAVGGPGNDTINVSTTGDVLLDGGGGDNIIRTGNGRAIAYGGGIGNNTVYGNATTSSSLVDILIGDGGDSPAADKVMGGPISAAPHDGTDTIYAQSNSNIIVGGTGKNDFYFDVNNYKPLLNIIWGHGAPSNYHFSDAAPNFVDGKDNGGFKVVVLNLDSPSIASLENLDVNAIKTKTFPKFPSPYGPRSVAVIINPSDQDKIYLDGNALDGGIYGPGPSSGTTTFYQYTDSNKNEYAVSEGGMSITTQSRHRFQLDKIKPGDFGISL